MKNKRQLYIIFLLLITSLILGGCSTLKSNNNPPKAIDGVLDLRNWDFSKDGNITLSGEWDFYFNEFLLEDDFNKESFINKKETIKVPGKWNKNEKFKTLGYATYRLKVLIDDDEDLMSLKIGSIMSAHKIFIDDNLLGGKGDIGRDSNNTKPYVLPYSLDFTPNTNEFEIVVQVSNFNHRSSGLREDILLGSHDLIHDMERGKIASELFLLGSIFIMGFYNLSTYFFRRKEKAGLFFSLVCLSIVLRIAVTGETFITLIFPNISWVTIFKLEYLSIYLAFMFYVFFIRAMYKEHLSCRPTKVTIVILLVLILIALFTPTLIASYTLYVFEVLFIGYAFYTFKVVISRYLIEKDESIILIIGFSVAFITAINDILHTNGLINTGYILPFGVFILILTHSIVLVKRLTSILNKFEKLARENEIMVLKIQRMNRDLEKKVEDRTKELVKKNRQLKDASITDGLTKFFNHTYIHEKLEEEIELAKKENKNLSIIMLDIDNFKSVNDTYGHQAGDEILKAYSKVIRESVRKGDLIGRYGGEEFLIILPDTDLEEGYIISERIRENVNKLKFKEYYREFSISGGVAEYEGEGSSKLIKRADDLLYKSKNSGKNKITKN